MLLSRRTKALLVLSAAIGTAPFICAFSIDPKNFMKAMRGGVRFTRAMYTGFNVIADYKINLYGLEKNSEEYNERIKSIHQRSADRLLAVCLKHGGLYTKLGQYIASMTYVLPDEYPNTLKILQDKNPHLPLDQIAPTFQEDFGKGPLEIFDTFEEEAVAAASLAQVHIATKGNRKLAVKVQYPHLRSQVDADISSLYLLSRLVEIAFPKLEYSWLFPEFRDSIGQELDFMQEAMNGERLQNMIGDDEDVVIPKIYWELSSSRILVQEFIDGVKISDKDALAELNIDPILAAKSLIKVFSDMVFYFGFIHCDPHPGNIFVRPKQGKTSTSGQNFQLVVLDHGMYRRLNPEFRQVYCQLWKAFITRNDELGSSLMPSFGLPENYFKYISMMMTYRPHSQDPFTEMFDADDIKSMQKEFHFMSFEEVTKMIKRLPRDLMFLMRGVNLVASINRDLGGTTSQRLEAFGESAVSGLKIAPMVVRNEKVEGRGVADMEARDVDFPRAIPSEEHPEWERVSRPSTANNRQVDLELLISKLKQEGNSVDWREFIELEGASETELNNQLGWYVYFLKWFEWLQGR